MKTGNRIALSAAVAGLAISVIGGFEGLRTTTYRDIVGIPTVCYGETRGVKMGQSYTKAECDAMLLEGLRQFSAKMDACLLQPAKIPDPSYVAMLSLAYNIGTGAFCRSTVARKVNAGDLAGACQAFMMWNKAGGKVVPGLTKRRDKERALCMKGVLK